MSGAVRRVVFRLCAFYLLDHLDHFVGGFVAWALSTS
jgi:hypothetical protein